MIKDIDKSKLVLAHGDSDDLIKDLPLETKEIGYYRDSWNRFKKNKASLTAFIIILFLMFFVVFGPYMKKYDLPQRDIVEAGRLDSLPPKIPGLEKLGIFNGHKKVIKGKRILHYIANSEYGEGIIISGFPEELKNDLNHPDYKDVASIEVVVDYYKYINFTKSYVPEDYFGLADDPKERNPLKSVTMTIVGDEKFNHYLENNYIIDVLNVRTVTNNKGEEVNEYQVRYDLFQAALGTNPENTYFWFGTTSAGEDLFSELWKGARISIIMAVSVLLINTIVGLTLGAIAGYYGGVVDMIFDRFVEIVGSVPFLPVLTLLTLRFGTATWVVVIAFTATGWIGTYGTGRMQFYRFKNREYALAAKTLGASDARIMFKHIFPNTLGLIITGMALAIPSFVFTEASYSFLGIIKYDNATSVGMLIERGQRVMKNFPHLLLYPSLYISIMMIAFNLFGNGLRDAFNPSLRGVE